MKIRSFLKILPALVILFINGCSTTDPVDELKPGRRDYVWSIDTLKAQEGRTLPSKMWGSSPNDLWAVGPAYSSFYCIWHYDGNIWENYIPDKYIDPTCIFGINANDIWIGGSDGAFWHYNGMDWKQIEKMKIPGYSILIIQNIYGIDTNNLYAVGYADTDDASRYKGVILHFNGQQWREVNIPFVKNLFTQIYYEESSGEYLINGFSFEGPEQSIFKFNGNELDLILTSNLRLTLAKIGRNIYLETENKLLKYNQGKFDSFKNFTSDMYIGNAWGRSETDFFTINEDGLGHFNGTDLITIYAKLNNEWSPSQVIVFDKDIFSIWGDSFYTFIIHGKLK